MNEILSKIDWNILNTYVENDLVKIVKHSEYDLWILNYSIKTSYNRLWDLFTLSCRGMVIDADGLIVGRCMKKFFNIEEPNPYDINMTLDYEIFEKADGSMISVFWYEKANKWIVTSRGSFISEQAIEAKKMFDSKPNIFDGFNKNYTYTFECIYGANRIVVNYGNMYDVILLTAIETNTGNELSYDDLVNLYSKDLIIIKKFKIKTDDLIELKKLEENNREGFVIKFSDGNRLKIKFAEYIRLHSIMTNISNVTVWEYLMNDLDFDELFDRVPDEMYEWLNKTIKLLRLEFSKIEKQALLELSKIIMENNITNRKEFAFEALKSKYSSILFKLYEKKSYDEIIWKMIKPKFSKPFKDGFENE